MITIRDFTTNQVRGWARTVDDAKAQCRSWGVYAALAGYSSNLYTFTRDDSVNGRPYLTLSFFSA
jgi:hypothetical protein